MVQVRSLEVSDERVLVGDGVSIPSSWVIMVRDEPGVAGVIAILVSYDAMLKRAVADEVRVGRQGDGDEVTSLTLREVRVQAALQFSGLGVSTVSEPDHAPVTGTDYIHRMRERTNRTATQSIVDAARTYQLAAAINLPPLRTVADSLGVSQSTATRLVNRARFDGLVTGVELRDPSATGPIVGPPTAGPSVSRG